MKVKPLIYVSGPITLNPFGCVRESMPVFEWLLDHDYTPFMPQWSVIAEIVKSLPYEKWMEYDLRVIRYCDALVRLLGESPGADRECAFAEEIGIPVFQWDADGMTSLLGRLP